MGGMRIVKDSPTEPLDAILLRAFSDCQQSQACHRRCVKELVRCRRQNAAEFTSLWTRCVFPILGTLKKEPSVERLVKFVVSYATYTDDGVADCSAFLEEFLTFLLPALEASNKNVRYRSCQVVSEIVLATAGEAEVASSLLDDITTCMQRRMQDKLPGIRAFAARALGRLYSPQDGLEDAATISQFRLRLSTDPSPEVRKTALLAMPVLDSTVSDIVERTNDVSDAVRKAAYSVLGDQMPIQSLSIRQRNTVLQRGLNDRELSVQAECVRMLKDGWLSRDCEGDPMALLRCLDVETNEKVGESAMKMLIKENAISIDGRKGLREYLKLDADGDAQKNDVRLMEPEEALYWRMVCDYLNCEAQALRLEAASTRGTKADLLEADAAEKSELLDAILPSTVSEFVGIIQAHYLAGSSHHFVSRQLLMLAKLLDFTDTTNRKAAAVLLETILKKDLSDCSSPSEMVDGIHVEGEEEWSDALVGLARKVHASEGAFEEAIASIVRELGSPCREGGANPLQWLQALTVTGLLLANINSLDMLPRHIIDPQELIDGLLLSAAVHLVPEVQRAGIRCLSIYLQLQEKPTYHIVQKLKHAVGCDQPSVKLMAVKGMFDAVMCHGVTELDRMTGEAVSDTRRPVLELLVSVLNEPSDAYAPEELEGEKETSRSVAVHGFAKLLIQSKLFPELEDLEEVILTKLLLCLDEDQPRLQQCLSVFFHNYASISSRHKKCLSKIFVSTLRAKWPGITTSTGAHGALARKKAATHLSRFMLELIKRPLYRAVETEAEDCNYEEYLAIRISLEVNSLATRRSASVKAYRSALCKVLTSLEFQPSRQDEIKTMRRLLELTMDVMAGEKLILKELKAMEARLQRMDEVAAEVLTSEQLQAMLDSLKIKLPSEAAAGEEEAGDEGVVVDTPAAARPRQQQQQQHPRASTQRRQTSAAQARQTTATQQRQRPSAARSCKTTAMQRLRTVCRSRAIDFDDSEPESELSGSE